MKEKLGHNPFSDGVIVPTCTAAIYKKINKKNIWSSIQYPVFCFQTDNKMVKGTAMVCLYGIIVLGLLFPIPVLRFLSKII